MVKKFWYYIDFGSGFQEVQIGDNRLKLEFEINKDWEGLAQKRLNGDFILKSPYYELVQTNFEGTGNADLPIKIYRDGTSVTGTLIYTGVITEFSDNDPNKSEVTVKNIVCTETTQVLIKNTLNSLDNTCKQLGLYGLYTEYDIYDNQLWSGELVTESAYRFADVFNNCFNDGGILTGPIAIDSGGDIWYGTPAIDITKLRMCPISDLRKDSSTTYGGSFSPLKVSDMFGLMRDLFKAYWYVDGINLKFKTPSDLAVNSLDLTTQMQHMQKKYADYELNYVKEVLNLHPNVFLDSFGSWLDTDWVSNKLNYQRNATKVFEINQSKIQTRYVRPTNINTDGWFLGYVNTSTDYLELETGKASGVTSQQNGRLCPANLLWYHYQNYLFTNRGNYELFGVSKTTPPVTFRPFVQMENVETSIASPETFYDSIIYKEDVTYNYISRVYKQSTDLNRNITTFEHYDFTIEAK